MKIPWLVHTFYKVQSGCQPPHLLYLERILTQKEFVHHYKKWVPTKLKKAKNLRHTLCVKKHNQDVSTTPSWDVRLDDNEGEADAEFFEAPGYIFYILILLNTFVPMFFLSLFFYCFCEVKWKHSNMVPNS